MVLLIYIWAFPKDETFIGQFFLIIVFDAVEIDIFGCIHRHQFSPPEKVFRGE